MQAIIVSRDQDEKDLLTYAFRKAGLAVASSSDVSRVLERWSDHPADVLLTSLMDSSDPLEVLTEIRSATQTPLIMLLDAPQESLVRQLLLQGADVVLARPVSPLLLTAHAQSLLRRSGGVPSFTLPTLELERIALDPSTRSVRLGEGEPLRLTQLEFRLLYVLMTNRNQVVPNEVLVERVWGYTGEGNRDLVRGLVSRLRHKIEPESEQSEFIETIPGVGYRFITDEI